MLLVIICLMKVSLNTNFKKEVMNGLQEIIKEQQKKKELFKETNEFWTKSSEFSLIQNKIQENFKQFEGEELSP